MTMAATIRVTKPRQMPPVHPGVILRDDVLPALNISVSAAAPPPRAASMIASSNSIAAWTRAAGVIAAQPRDG